MVFGKELESVGTYLQIDGMTYPMNADGPWSGRRPARKMDSYYRKPVWWGYGVHLREIEPDGDWMTNLSDEDRKTVEAVLIWIS